MKKAVLTLVLLASVSNVSFASREADLQHQQECVTVIDAKETEINNYIKSREETLIKHINFFFSAHKVTWNTAATALEGLKATQHQQLSEAKKLYQQLLGFRSGDTGSKAKCENLANLLLADYKKIYDNIEQDALPFLHGFLKCPSKLTKDDIRNLREVQDGKLSTNIAVDNKYFKNTIPFYVNADDMGNKFPKITPLSLDSATNSNALVAEKIRTERDRTYCSYKWKNSVHVSHETTIYYRNDK